MNPPHPTPSPIPSDADRLAAEIAKLRAETLKAEAEARDLRIRWWQRPANLAIIVSVVSALAGGVQFVINQYYEVQATLRKAAAEVVSAERARNEAANKVLEYEQKVLEAKKAELQAQEKQKNREITDKGEQIARLTRQLDDKEAGFARRVEELRTQSAKALKESIREGKILPIRSLVDTLSKGNAWGPANSGDLLKLVSSGGTTTLDEIRSLHSKATNPLIQANLEWVLFAATGETDWLNRIGDRLRGTARSMDFWYLRLMTQAMLDIYQPRVASVHYQSSPREVLLPKLLHYIEQQTDPTDALFALAVLDDDLLPPLRSSAFRSVGAPIRFMIEARDRVLGSGMEREDVNTALQAIHAIDPELAFAVAAERMRRTGEDRVARRFFSTLDYEDDKMPVILQAAIRRRNSRALEVWYRRNRSRFLAFMSLSKDGPIPIYRTPGDELNDMQQLLARTPTNCDALNASGKAIDALVTDYRLLENASADYSTLQRLSECIGAGAQTVGAEALFPLFDVYDERLNENEIASMNDICEEHSEAEARQCYEMGDGVFAFTSNGTLGEILMKVVSAENSEELRLPQRWEALGFRSTDSRERWRARLEGYSFLVNVVPSATDDDVLTGSARSGKLRIELRFHHLEGKENLSQIRVTF